MNNLKSQTDILNLLDKKINTFYDIIQRSILYVQKNKMLDILGVSEVNTCVNSFFEVNKKIKEIMNRLNIYRVNNEIVNTEDIINEIQNINNELSLLFKTFGTERLEDMLLVCLGNTSASVYANTETDKCKFDLLQKYFHPTSYRLLLKKDTDKNINIKIDKTAKNDKTNDEVNDNNHNLECSNVSISNKSFHLKVYGMQVIFHNIVQKIKFFLIKIISEKNVT